MTRFRAEKYQANWKLLDRIISNKDAQLIPVGKLHCAEGKPGSPSTCAVALAFKELFGVDSYVRVYETKKSGRHIGLSQPGTSFRYYIPLHPLNGFDPEQFDKNSNTTKPGNLVINGGEIKTRKREIKKQPLAVRVAAVKEWKARTAYKQPPPRVWA